MKDKVIYTSVTGGYDRIVQPQAVYADFDYICFTNDVPPQTLGVWQIRPIPVQMDDPIRLSRYVKLLPHRVLADYACSCYVDMNIVVKSGLLRECIERHLAAGAAMAAPVHPTGRDCVYKEARAIVDYNRDDFIDVARQVRFLHREGYPYGNGLYENNIIFRRHNDERVKAVSELWWQVFCRFCHRDQLSLTYALWKVGLGCEPFFPEGVDIYSTAHFDRLRHAAKDAAKPAPTPGQRLRDGLKECERRFCLKFLKFLVE